MTKQVPLERESFCCSICLELLHHPVSLPCGHSYCMGCILTHWDTDHKTSHRCPQCRHTFTPRPALAEDNRLANDVERLRQMELAAAPPGAQRGAEPKTRAELLTFGQIITVDPETAHGCQLSEGNRRVLRVAEHRPRHFFTDVLSSQRLTRRCYWEVEWTGLGQVDVTVVAKGYSGDGTLRQHIESWGVFYNGNCFIQCHNGPLTPILADRSSRVGVYLDHDPCVLCFYSVVINTVTLIYRVCAPFTRPFRAGVRIHDVGGTAEFCELH